MQIQNRFQQCSFSGLILLLIIMLSVSSQAQISENYSDLKQYIQRQPKVDVDSSEFLSIYHNHSLHYLYPLYKSFSLEKRGNQSKDQQSNFLGTFLKQYLLPVIMPAPSPLKKLHIINLFLRPPPKN